MERHVAQSIQSNSNCHFSEAGLKIKERDWLLQNDTSTFPFLLLFLKETLSSKNNNLKEHIVSAPTYSVSHAVPNPLELHRNLYINTNFKRTHCPGYQSFKLSMQEPHTDNYQVCQRGSCHGATMDCFQHTESCQIKSIILRSFKFYKNLQQVLSGPYIALLFFMCTLEAPKPWVLEMHWSLHYPKGKALPHSFPISPSISPQISNPAFLIQGALAR